jgi:hypothetical protein
MAPEPSLIRNYRCSNEKLTKALGVTPSRTVLQAVREMTEAFIDWPATKFTDPRFYNIDWLMILNEAYAGVRPFGYVLRRDEGSRQGE